jgi:hypothetical protein
VTKQYALNFIKAKMKMDDSQLKNELAEGALAGAVNFFSLLGEYRWNEQYLTATLTSGTSLYRMDDLVSDYQVRRIFDECIWFTGERQKVEIVDRERYNAESRGTTSTGKPRIAIVHSKDMIVEFWPTPNDNYAIWFMGGIVLTDISELPEELQLPAVNLAIMAVAEADSPALLSAQQMWALAAPLIPQAGSWTIWKGNQVKPDDNVLGNPEGSGYGVDSTNVVGEL